MTAEPTVNAEGMKDPGGQSMPARPESYRTNKIVKRDPSYQVEDLNCCCFVRNINMRAATFEMSIIEISHTAVTICDHSLNCIAFKAGDILTITIDIHRRLFSRPINIHYRVIHTLIEERRKNYGLELIEVNDFHQQAYEAGINALTSERETEHSLFHEPSRKREAV
jgi:hypothetical protein